MPRFVEVWRWREPRAEERHLGVTGTLVMAGSAEGYKLDHTGK